MEDLKKKKRRRRSIIDTFAVCERPQLERAKSKISWAEEWGEAGAECKA